MKIAIIMPLAEQRGGGELMLLHLMQQGRGAGVEWLVIFLAGRADGRAGAGTGRDGAGHRCGPPAGSPSVRRRRAPDRTRWRGRKKSRLIFGWMNQGQFYGGPAARLAGIPAVWYQLGIPLDPGWNDRMATRLPARGILACSEAGARRAGADHAGAAPARRLSRRGTGTVRAGDLPAPAEARRRLGLPLAGPLIGIVGRLQRWKGMHVLIEAMPEILARPPGRALRGCGRRHALEPDYPAFLRERDRRAGAGRRQ